MDEEFEGRLEDLQLVEIQELLEENGLEFGDEEIAELARFVMEAGGVEEALEVLSQISHQEEAA